MIHEFPVLDAIKAVEWSVATFLQVLGLLALPRLLWDGLTAAAGARERVAERRTA